MRRRDVIAGLCGATIWSLSAAAQQSRSLRKIGMLVNYPSGEPDGQARINAFSGAMRKIGWIEGENLRTEIRCAGDEADRFSRYARELVELAPDVIVAGASPSVAALQGLTHNVPVVFAGVIDPVGAGFVKSLARPGGNTTGFTVFEYSVGGKWLELLKEIAPGVKRVAVIRDPSVAAGIGQFAAIQALASSSSEMELTAIDPAGLVRIWWRVRRRSNRDGKRLSNRASRAVVLVGAPISSANSLSVPILRGRWRPGRLRAGFDRDLRALGRVCRPNTQGRKTGGPPGSGSHAI